MTIERATNIQRFTTSRTTNLDAYVVIDRNAGEAVAGPYLTQAQACYVAFWLNDDPTSVPYAPDPMGDVLEVLRRWRP